jgi:two-component system chemotaxis response regulator CheV
MAALDTGILLETGTNELEIIEFFIDEDGPEGGRRHYFGVNVAKVLEVLEAPPGLAPSPGAPHPSFLGTIPLRDLILPVVDLSVWLELRRGQRANEPIIVTEFNNVITGFLVSGVTMIHRVNWGQVEPPSRVVAGLHTNCITGTVHMEGHFTLLLDLELALAELGGLAGQEPAADTPRAEERFRALVADDSTSVRQLLRQNFEAANFEVRVVSDGAAAWSALQEIKAAAAAEGRPVTDYLDVLVSDVEMPLLDGYTLTRRVKGDPELGRLPVVLFSSLISKGLRHKGEAVKADDQVTKPEFAALTDRVLQVIRRNR